MTWMKIMENYQVVTLQKSLPRLEAGEATLCLGLAGIRHWGNCIVFRISWHQRLGKLHCQGLAKIRDRKLHCVQDWLGVEMVKLLLVENYRLEDLLCGKDQVPGKSVKDAEMMNIDQKE